jgi:hypothetical protein
MPTSFTFFESTSPSDEAPSVLTVSFAQDPSGILGAQLKNLDNVRLSTTVPRERSLHIWILHSSYSKIILSLYNTMMSIPLYIFLSTI